CRNKHETSGLNYRCEHKDQSPQSYRRHSHGQKPEGSENRLDECNAENAERDATNRCPSELLKLGPSLSEKANRQKAREFMGSICVGQEDSGNQNREQKLQDDKANSGRSREQALQDCFDLRCERFN